jgi:hypothetical protein
MKNNATISACSLFEHIIANGKLAITVLLIAVCHSSFSQNLIINPGAELSPAGTGWTIVSAGSNVCVAGSAAATYSNWVMTPDGSANYPAAHGGTKTFYAGCNTTVPAGPFELYQDIDVSSDAVQIDGGSVSFSFSGYIQTPISPQADAGRFIVDYLSSSGSVLGTSYTSAYQSFSGGSGSSWVPYTNTRAAASGTRKIRVRLQATIATGPAINAYFDDISLTKLIALGIDLVSFRSKDSSENVILDWSVSDAAGYLRFEIDKSLDTLDFLQVGRVDYVKDQNDYHFSDRYEEGQNPVFYRLKMFGIDSLYYLSPTLVFHSPSTQIFTVSPNPASKNIDVAGLHNNGIIFIRDMSGNTVLQSRVNANSISLNITRLQAGIYWVSYSDGKSLRTQKLIVR